MNIILNFLIQRQALDAATTGNVYGILVAIDYVLLLVASIVGLAVIIERLVRLRRTRLYDDSLFAGVPEFVRKGDIEGAEAACDDSPSPLAAIIALELGEFRTGHVPMEEAMEAASECIDEKLNANIDILATVVKIAPLLGLLGTVLGMTYAFGQIDAGTRKETLAQGITAALDTTVRGLIIAILCLGFERVIHRRIDTAARRFEALFTRIVRAARRNAKEAA